MSLTKEARFFYRHAGTAYNPATETPRQGREKRARRLARAERIAKKNGWTYLWEPDPESCIGCDCEDKDCRESHDCLICILKDENGKVLSSLGSICKPSREYCRVIAAELALEVAPDWILERRLPG